MANNITRLFKRETEENLTPGAVLTSVYSALEEKGYDPVTQLVGYLLSGEPTYITSHKDARSKIQRVERDELLDELVRSYIQNNPSGKEI